MSDATPPPPRSPEPAIVFRWLPLAVWLVSMASALAYLDRGWFPHDLGSVAHPAQRVLLGELPHRDFDDVYTGGLAFVNAFAFRLFGESATAARWMVLGAFAAWVPALWMVARSSAGVWVAAAITLLGAAWTLPMYAEGMPSWYNLFLATFALLAFLEYAHRGRRRWLFWAGVAAGSSMLFKVTGLYTVAACLLGIAWLEDASRPDDDDGSAHRSDALYRWFIAACALGLAGAVTGLVVRAMGPSGLVRFGLPAAAPALVAAWAARRPTGVSSSRRFRDLARTALPLVGGVAAALAPFLVLYAFQGALDDLWRGVFVLPRRRFAEASWTGLRGGVVGMALSAAVVTASAFLPRTGPRLRRLSAGLAAAAGAAALMTSGTSRVYGALWQGLWWLPPAVALAAVASLVGRRPGGPGADRDVRIFLTLAVFGLASLVEVPFAAPIYFFYAAPLLALLGLALAGTPPHAVRPEGARDVRSATPPREAWLLGVTCFLLAFTALRLVPGFVRHLGLQPARHHQTEVLRIPRGGGLRVDAAAREEVETVVRMVEALAPGPFVYATPDAPEVYVLTGRRNPTRTLFEFLDPDPGTRARRVLAALDRTGVELVVINRRPLFSEPVDPELVAGLQARYPAAREVGRFLVVWKPAERIPADPIQP